MTEKVKEKLTVMGRKVTVKTSDRKGKQLHAVSTDGKNPEIDVHFGDKDMPEFPGTKRGDNYCSRSLGIADRFDIRRDLTSANFWSRWYLWNCQGKKSLKKRGDPKKV